MAVAALVVWMCTAAVGSYLLATAARSRTGNAGPGPAEPVSVAAEQPVAGPVLSGGHRFDPPSLQRDRTEPVPYLKALAEFAHPALAITGFVFWFGYVVSRDRLFAAIGLGVMLGAICAGLSWAASNRRAARRAGAAAQPGAAGAGHPGSAPLTVSHRVLALHAAGAGLTLLLAALIAAHV